MQERVAPIFIVADDDQQAIAGLMDLLGDNWFYIPVTKPGRVLRYSREFATTAILIADRIGGSEEAAAHLLQKLLDTVGKPVVVLAELWDPEVERKWKRVGAYACVPHPTRSRERMRILSEEVKELALRQVAVNNAEY